MFNHSHFARVIEMKTMAVRALICTQLSLLLFAGCSSDSNPPTFPVSGTVTLDGKAVDGASITFISAENPNYSATALSDASGNYKLGTFAAGDGAVEGTFKIRVTKFASGPEVSPYDTPASQVIDTENLSPEDAAAAISEGYGQGYQGPPKAGWKPPKQSNDVPDKYSDAEKSGLTYQVVKGPNTHNLELNSKK
jgi:hypothetical protein